MSAKPASAAIESYIVHDSDKIFYQYNFSSLLNSYNQDGELWKDFEKRMMRSGVHAIYDNKSLLYVDFRAILEAYNNGSEVLAYTESPKAKEASVPELIKQVLVDEAGKLTYENKYKSGDVVSAINNSSSASEVRQLLEVGAEKLGLDLKSFNSLNSYGKNQVSQAVLDNRPAAGYSSKDSIKTVFNNAVSTALSKQQAAVEAVNNAGTAAAMQTALSNHAQLLELDFTRFTKLTPDQQSTMLEIILNGKPYDSADKVTTAYISALQSVELTHIITYVDYDHNLSYYVDKQMSKNPQTDLYGGGWKTADRNLVEWFINAANFVNEMRPAAIIKSGPARMRTGPGTEHDVVCLLDEGSGPYFRINEAVDSAGYTWYRLLTGSRVGWVRGDLLTLTEKKGEGIFQFLLLSETTHVDPSEVNEKILKGKGILEGKAEAFITGAETYNINEIFLISLALHETGNGKSTLATGVNFKGKTVYNMYGIGAIDADPINKGAEYAYNQGWFTPEAAIIGGAKFVGESYIHHSTYRQNTLYKMRWNPDRPGQHQYATDIGWAAKQVSGIKKLYDLMTSYVLHFEIPRFK